jgi:hypothetical protein
MEGIRKTLLARLFAPAASQGRGGPHGAGVEHAYRVERTTFSIEFVNVSPDAEGNPANHIHCV